MGLSVKWGHSPATKRGRRPHSHGAPQFSTHVYCGQKTAWIKMPLGTEVGLGSNDIALGGDPAPPHQLECGPMLNVMVALPNIGGALCSTPQSFGDAHYLTAVQ